MSLKNFHLVFIAVATILAFGAGLWAFVQRSLLQEAELVAAGLLALASGSALLLYWFRVRRILPGAKEGGGA